MRRSTAANARRLFAAPSWIVLYRYGVGVVGSFYAFVIDVAEASGLSRLAIESRIARIEGAEQYRRMRESGRGAVLVTAHMGSFEVGLAALRQVEPGVHVVFKRDAFGGFEALRSNLRARLGVQEAAIDDGWGTLTRLRDALAADEVVVVQGDRAFPGQRTAIVPFVGGHLAIPAGPATLARLHDSPIVPTFVVREPDGRFVVHLLEPIFVGDRADSPDDGVDSAIHAIAAAIERFVIAQPEQWLVLEPAFVEDRARAAPATAR